MKIKKEDSSKIRSLWLIVFAIVIVALNLRPNMTAIGPLLNDIQATIHASYTQVSLFTMLPIITMGIGMFIGNSVKQRVGLELSVLLSIILIMISTFARVYYFDSNALILTAIISGIGIAIIQALMPIYIKTHFKNVSIVMGFYVTAIMGGATLSASLSPYLSELLDGWQNSFAVWGLFALLGVIAWLFIGYLPERNKSKEPENPVQLRRFFTNKRAWILAIFFSLNTACYTCILAWFAPYYLDLGFTQKEAGLMMAYLTTLEVIAGLTVPTLSAKYRDKRAIFVVLLSILIVGFIGLILMPKNGLFVWPLLIGIGGGSIFPMGLIVCLDHIPDPNKSGALTAFVQGIGYTIAGFSPFIAGEIRAYTHSFEMSWLFLIVIMAIMIPIALIFDPKKYDKLKF